MSINPARAVRTLLTDPSRAVGKMKAVSYRVLSGRQFAAGSPYRSDSDNGLYVASVERALASRKHFARFKQDPDYRGILEHVSREQGQAYLDLLRGQAPDVVSRAEEFKVNDWVGSPTRFTYDGVGLISPTTLRYMKVASDLRQLFGNLEGAEIAEVGGGYGGQMLVADKLLRFNRYTIYDLPPVLALIRRYVEVHLLRGAFGTRTLNEDDGSTAYDLVISNYAFSELPEIVQLAYLAKMVKGARRGYLTMNSGRGLSAHDTDKMTLEKLREHLPPFEVFEERPLTAPGGYIIVWGHTGSLS